VETPLGAIFDMDGVLIDSEPLWHIAEVEIFGELGVPLDRAQTRSTKGMPIPEVTTYWYERFPWNGNTPAEVADQVVDRVTQLILEQAEPMPGARELVVGLAEVGPVALASSSPKRLIDAVLGSLDLLDVLELRCSAEDEAFGKPHPAVFIAAAQRMGIQPDRCVVIEDAPAGVLAAKAARMACVAIPEASERTHPQILIADLVVESLREVDAARALALIEP
jgi:mannitol-1-/sugar-/sorbitol-6-/2-deoxyglucose-6-phosphatase